MLEMQTTPARAGYGGYQSVPTREEDAEEGLTQHSRGPEYGWREEVIIQWNSLSDIWQKRIIYACGAMSLFLVLIIVISLSSHSHPAQRLRNHPPQLDKVQQQQPSPSSPQQSQSQSLTVYSYVKPVLPLRTTINDAAFGKSPSDKRLYSGFVLPNSLEVLLISDPNVDKSSASVAVGVGSWSDGAILGLAHFLEHMLFMGTDKFPSESEYADYLASHGGMTNAYTAEDRTVFFFSVEPSAFQGAVDRFAQFFIAPLLKADAVDREMLAVNNEHEKNLNDDDWRMYELLKQSDTHTYAQAQRHRTGRESTSV